MVEIQAAYDAIADEYAQRVYDELKDKPLDRQLLDGFADRVRGQGTVCDLGSGPGHVGRYLHERGLAVCGVDLSPEMVKHARSLNPGIDFQCGDMFALDVEDGAWVGIAALYAIVNLPRTDVTLAFQEMRRVLKPGGWLLLGFHVGEGGAHVDEWWGVKISLDFNLFGSDEVARYLRAAGFEVEETTVRDPYPDVEYQTRRSYILAQKI